MNADKLEHFSGPTAPTVLKPTRRRAAAVQDAEALVMPPGGSFDTGD